MTNEPQRTSAGRLCLPKRVITSLGYQFDAFSAASGFPPIFRGLNSSLMTSCRELRGMSTQDGRHDVIIHRSLPQGDLTAHSHLRVYQERRQSTFH